MKELIWLVPVLPFLGAFLNGVVLRGRVSKGVAAGIACGAVGLAALLSLGIIGDYLTSTGGQAHRVPFERDYYTWMPGGMIHTAVGTGVQNFSVSMGFLLDALSCVMLFVVTFVGFWIHVYSVGYMAHEDGFQRFFTYLNLFMGAMLLLVLGNSYAVMFVGWEGVGLCSYLLIGFYFKEEFPPYAGRKAFITNRVGDFAFVLGLFALIANFGTLKYTELFEKIAANRPLMESHYHLGLTLASFIALALFIGATGKSAQIPLYVWLPDAMAGPTPVSALIHAATMVTAGVYMVVRSNVIYQLSPNVSNVVAIVGAATALFAGTIGLAQYDIKKVLAYSTVSQLGYMFLAAGVGAYSAAIFHVMTHAFFKALLFLGSGSVIHAMGGEQDMRKMGGLRKYLPVTYWTFLVGTLAIAGVPLFAGFFSKDQILGAAAGHGNWVLYAMGLLTAALTACYMFRAFFLTFHGAFRGTHEQEHHLHESPPSMAWPLRVLAVGAVVAGYVGIPAAMTFKTLDINYFDRLLRNVLVQVPGLENPEEHPLSFELMLILASIAAAGFGIWLGWRIWYRRGIEGEHAVVARFPAAHRVLENKYYVDEFYDATVIRGFWSTARGLFRFDAGFIDGFLVNGTRNVVVYAFSLGSSLFDKYIVDGLVNGVGRILDGFSRGFRRLQTGYVANYALVLAMGMFALICVYMVLRRG
ncbi:MAG TPA: NADH-quinone oxidoreductase subunit L [Thermoanaerobaculia bacterium]|jgi:NADH-quinone oxidoreductase subunit L|nr:NADH-quinone oxidoreductase subunit L [Thermoanaerobaculia bacterium]